MLLAIFLAGGVATALDLKFITGGKPRPALANSLLVLDARTLATVRNVPGGKAPSRSRVVRAAGLVWTVNGEENRLLATDDRSGRVVRDVVVGTEPIAVAIGFGSVWVANAGNGSITRVALAGAKVEALGLNDEPAGIATGAGSVWVVSQQSKKLRRIDPETNLATKTVRFSHEPLDVVVRSGRVYLTIGD